MSPAALLRNSEVEPVSNPEYLDKTPYLIFDKSEPTPPDLEEPPPDFESGEDHGGTACLRTSEVDSRAHCTRKVRDLLVAEERSLHHRAKAGDKGARDDLILSHQPLCAKVAKRYRSSKLPFDEAISAAMTGLITAVDGGGFDPNAGRLATYAWLFMKGEVLKASREVQRVVHHPRGVMPGFEESFDNDGNADPPSLHDSFGDDAPTQEDTLADSEEAGNLRAALLLALDKLNDRERRIFVARRVADDAMTLEELATELGISGERVRQIEYVATTKVFAAAPKSLAGLNAERQRDPEKISPAQACYYGSERRIVAVLFRRGSNQSVRERLRDIFHELIELGDPPLRALQRLRWTIMKWFRNQRAVVVQPSAVPAGDYRSLTNDNYSPIYRPLIDQNYSPEWAARLTAPHAQAALRRHEIAAHNNLTSWAGRLADRGPRLVAA